MNLDNLVITAPCPITWESMQGNDRVRHCGGCSRNVYNIADMSAAEAEQFLQENGTRHCMRIFRRADGKLMTDNCPAGLRAIRNKIRLLTRIGAGLVASILAMVPLGLKQVALAQDSEAQQGQQPDPNDLTGFIQVLPKTKENTATAPGAKLGPGEQANNLGGATIIIRPFPSSSGQKSGGLHNKQIMIDGENCNDRLNRNFSANATQPSTTQAATAVQATDLRDSRAYTLYLSAKEHARLGKFLLAQTQLQQALKITRTQTIHPDPNFVRLITEDLNDLRKHLTQNH